MFYEIWKANLLKQPRHFTDKALLRVARHLALVLVRQEVVTQQRSVGKGLYDTVHKASIS